jgi:hypothetical protein
MPITLKRSLLSALLFVSVALPLHAYHPGWVRTHLLSSVAPMRSIGNVDVNGDGRPDVVGISTSHTLHYALAQADSTLAAAVTFHTGMNLSDLAIGDFDGDGDGDFVTSDIGTNGLVFLPSNSNGTFGTSVPTALLMAPSEIASGHYNGDTHLDLVVVHANEALLVVYAGDGAGHFSEASRMAAPSGPILLTPGDIDGDGHTDFLIERSQPKQYQLYFGNGDATFDAPIGAPASLVSYRVRIEDLDGDGDREIITANYVVSSVDVIVNLGSRTFAAPVIYPVQGGINASDAADLAVAEVTGDGFADVVVTLLQSKRIATLPGNGNGTLRAPAFAGVPPVSNFTTIFPNWLTAADFTGDGRIDLAVYGSSRLTLLANAAGEGTLTTRAIHPTITVGQKAKYEVSFTPAFLQSAGHSVPYATGLVTIREGATVLGTGTMQNDVVTIEVPSLTLGTHPITASFAGDENYRALTATAVTQNVITESTTLVLIGPTENVQYGDQVTLHAQVTSPLPGNVTGWVSIYKDGQPAGTIPANGYAGFAVDTLGTYEFHATYDGSATHPPATSSTIEVTVVRAATHPRFPYLNENHYVRYGQQPQITVAVESEGSIVSAGAVHIYDGSTLLATVDANYEVPFTLPVLSPGVHYLQARYSGDEHHEPSQSAPQRVTILPAQGFALDVYVLDDGDVARIVAAGFFTVAEGGYYKIYRKIGNGSWQYESNSWLPLTSVVAPAAGQAYAYRMEAYDASGGLLATSNVDLAMIASFSDKPLIPGTPVRAVHVQELVAATNALRTAAGLSSISLSNVAPGQPIRLQHLSLLRDGLNQARVALGAAPVVYSGDAALNALVLSRHFQELRDAIQ